jgi:hypothetical protein
MDQGKSGPGMMMEKGMVPTKTTSITTKKKTTR